MYRFANGAAWIGGELVPVAEARIPVTDWALTHSDVVYDVVPVWDGAFFRLDDHLARFRASMEAWRLAPPEGPEVIRAALHAVVAASGLRAAYVAMVAARGQPLVPGERDPRRCANHFYAWCVPYVHVFGADAAARGVRLHIAEGVRRIPPDSVDPRAKNYHWGDFTRGLFEAKDAGADSVVLLDHAGNLTEGPGFNVFAVIGGRLVTPAEGCLEGITRATLLELAAAEGIDTETRALPRSELAEAQEMLACTSGGGPVPVTHLDGHVFANGAEGPVTARLRAAYWARMAEADWRTPVAYPSAAPAS
ncbi:D-amino acid aminotransferase [Paralimibaculum aggregatum]|uniref:Probable branched-chain-amino-acid aminotransferase n=1 Tax=Paralimibaculum aggregatum TaxID=3036245 RepID=A0ABQ6LD15_9RHOB|nr:aminotransferase class IV [Limibaculum sp. NKW23]GMG81256.1 D-amino acid aminotransferase [Limibaculum sp. NKW23]